LYALTSLNYLSNITLDSIRKIDLKIVILSEGDKNLSQDQVTYNLSLSFNTQKQ